MKPDAHQIVAWAVLSLLLMGSVPAYGQARSRRQRQPNVVELKQFSVKGTITGMRGDLIQWTDENQRVNLVKLDPKRLMRITVTGTAEPSFLRPGLFVRFLTTPDERGKITETIGELTIFSPADGFQPGVFPEDPGNPKGPVLVAGRIKSLRKGKMTLLVGRQQVKVQLAEEPKIAIEVTDLRIVSPGDQIEVTGFGQTAQQLIARTIDIKLAKPLSGPKKKRRR